MTHFVNSEFEYTQKKMSSSFPTKIRTAKQLSELNIVVLIQYWIKQCYWMITLEKFEESICEWLL